MSRPAALAPRTRRWYHPVAFLAALAAMVALPHTAEAQGVQYTTRITTESGGPMAGMMGNAGGNEASESRTYILGPRMRTDHQNQSTLVDLESGLLIMLDHDEGTVMRTTPEEMAEEMARLRSEMQEEMGSGNDVEMSFPAPEVHELDDTRTIQGHEARRVAVTSEATLGLGESMQGMPGGGSEMKMMTVHDMWMAPDIPGMEFSSDQAREWADRMAEAMEGLPGAASGFTAMATDPDFAGIPLRSVTSMVMILGDGELELDPILDGADEPLDSGGGMGALARAMMGGGGGAQMVFMRTVSEVTALEEGGVDPSVFEVPADYRETTFAEMMGR